MSSFAHNLGLAYNNVFSISEREIAIKGRPLLILHPSAVYSGSWLLTETVSLTGNSMAVLNRSDGQKS